jgi:hypothetical protein
VKPAVVTVVTRSYLAHARVLAEELRRYHPDVPLFTVIADPGEDGEELSAEPFRVVGLDELGDPRMVEEMCYIYSPFELCCALRGLLHRYVLRRTDVDRWLFLDADVFICGELTPVLEEIGEGSITLSPHITSSVYPERRDQPELEYLSGGIYNGGVLGLRRDETTERFVDWFCARLRHYALAEPPTFVDQLWLNLVPLLFPGTRHFAHRGVNVAHWNIHERPLGLDPDGTIRVGHDPLLLAHFSGADLEDGSRISKHAPWLDGHAPPAWGELLGRYGDALERHGHRECQGAEYGHGRHRDGTPITPEQRRAHRELLIAGAGGEDSPFDPPPELRRPRWLRGR